MACIALDNGLRFSVTDLNPRGRRTVVFIHGWPLNKEIFESQYTILPEYDIRCIGIDLRGFGSSDKPWSGYTYNRIADDIYRLLQELNLRDVTLCGFSMGGAICVRYMARHRGARVKKLVLLGAAVPSFVQRPGFPYGWTREQVDGVIVNMYQDRPAATAQFVSQCFATPPSGQYQQWLISQCMQAAGWAVLRTAEQLRDEDLRSDLAKIQVPTAILHGTQDRICPFALAEEMQKGIRNSFIVPFKRSGHCLFYEEKDRCNSALIDFILS